MFEVHIKLVGKKDFLVIENVLFCGLQSDFSKNTPVYFFQSSNGEQTEIPLSSVLYIKYSKGRFEEFKDDKILFTAWFKTIDPDDSVIQVSDVLYSGLKADDTITYYLAKKSGESYEIPLHSLAYLRFSKERADRKEEEQKSDQQKL